MMMTPMSPTMITSQPRASVRSLRIGTESAVMSSGAERNTAYTLASESVRTA